MKRKLLGYFSLVLALLMVVCSVNFVSAVSGTVADTFKGINISKAVKLTGFVIGDHPTGMDQVVSVLNNKLKKDINATVTFNTLGWGDYSSKYPLVLASGEDVDFIFAANWMSYAQEAAKGAFYELKDNMLKKYMPTHYALLKNTAAFKEARVNGKVYMIPTSTPDIKTSVMVIREDLRVKYNVPPVNKVSDLEPFLKAIKKNEPSMIPINLDNTYDIGRVMAGLYNEAGPGWYDLLGSNVTGSGIMYDTDDATGALHKITDAKVLATLLPAAKKTKSWYDKGYINKDVFANKVRSQDSIVQGKSAVAFSNTVNVQGLLAAAQAKNMKLKVMAAGLTAKGHYPADPYLNSGVALGANTSNPERTLMFLDLIMENPVYDQLIYYGVEGKNFVVKNGKISLPDGVTADKNTYPVDSEGFWFTNKNILKPQASWSDLYIKLRNDAKKQVYPNVYAAFAPITDNIKTEIANLSQVCTQYFTPIAAGAVKDVDAAFKNLNQKLTAAGIDKVMKEMKKQTDAYKASQK